MEMSESATQYAGAQGLDPELIKAIEKQFGFDQPLHIRYFKMLKNYLVLELGESYYQNRPVIELIKERLPVSISLGLWSMLLVYTISIPMGIAKAVRDGSRFDAWTSGFIFVGYAVPSFLFAVFLIVLFAGGSYLDIFPLKGLTSNNFEDLSPMGQVADYFWHMALPVTALTIGGFATLTMLTKNSFLDEISKQYVLTARAKGINQKRVLYGHVFRNAMLIVIAGFPAALVGVLFTGVLLIEVIFSLDGLGLLGFEAVLRRDYPIMFGTLFVFTFIGLIMTLVGDITYTLVDPRIDFDTREN
jgi:microcin C transport system permease protein